MNEVNSKKLFDSFPEFFVRDNPKESLMCFGFMCSDGWFDLIWNLCSDIKKQLPATMTDFQVVEIKEKFGGLRFYTFGGNKATMELIRVAEAKSYKICEICGKPGKLMVKTGWYRTVCDTCAKKEGYKELPKQ